MCEGVPKAEDFSITISTCELPPGISGAQNTQCCFETYYLLWRTFICNSKKNKNKIVATNLMCGEIHTRLCFDKHLFPSSNFTAVFRLKIIFSCSLNLKKCNIWTITFESHATK